MIEVLDFPGIGRAAVLNTMVAGGELIGFLLICAAFYPVIKFLLQERKDLMQEKKDLLETLRAMGVKDVE